MNNKITNIYVCTKCDAQSGKWSGRCLSCGSWGTLVMQTIDGKRSLKDSVRIDPSSIIDFNDIMISDSPRLATGIQEADRVLGGGIVPGSLILLSGEPGIGKSTLVAQIADSIQKKLNVLYVSGEESAFQVKERFDRLKIKTSSLFFLNETNVEKIIAAINSTGPKLVIIDSIQTLYSSNVDSEAGSISQIRAAAAKLLETSKESGISIIIIGHITKDGAIAGPKSLEHIVDTVIYLETETSSDLRILRSTKNRFGSVNELGIFRMTVSGFEEVKNPSAIFLDVRNENISGSVISCLIEGTRPFLVETQALVTKTVFGYPQRKASGYDLNRLIVLIAVLTKRAGINLSNQDVILNVVGGLKINDPAFDLAICLAIAASLLDQEIDRQTIVIGEVGLGGEIRNVRSLEQRLKEAEKLGFKKAIIPDNTIKAKGMELIKVKRIGEVIRIITEKTKV